MYCIDGAGTSFLDDAFSVDPDTREVFIHITDVQGLVAPGRYVAVKQAGGRAGGQHACRPRFSPAERQAQHCGGATSDSSPPCFSGRMTFLDWFLDLALSTVVMRPGTQTSRAGRSPVGPIQFTTGRLEWGSRALKWHYFRAPFGYVPPSHDHSKPLPPPWWSSSLSLFPFRRS